MGRRICLLILILFSAIALGKPIGPSDGGGTNLDEKGNLADFKKFKEEFGKNQWAIDPRKFKLCGEARPIYDEIRPLLDRVEYYIPGSRKDLDGVFDKAWVVLDRPFPGRRPQERKVVSQTTVIYLSYPWLVETQ